MKLEELESINSELFRELDLDEEQYHIGQSTGVNTTIPTGVPLGYDIVTDFFTDWS